MKRFIDDIDIDIHIHIHRTSTVNQNGERRGKSVGDGKVLKREADVGLGEVKVLVLYCTSTIGLGLEGRKLDQIGIYSDEV